MRCQFPIDLKEDTVPCGQCNGCRVREQGEKSAQQLIEYSHCQAAVAITLSYQESHLPRTTDSRTVALFDVPRDDGHPLQGNPWMADPIPAIQGAEDIRKAERYHGFTNYEVVHADQDPDLVEQWRWNRRQAERDRMLSRWPDYNPRIEADRESMQNRLDERMAKIGRPKAFAKVGPGAPTLEPGEVQAFFKRLRYYLDEQFGPGNHEIAYAVAGEYGDKRGRPHWHVNLFWRKPATLALSNGDQVEITDESLAEWLLGTDQEPGPLRKAWPAADWAREGFEPEKKCQAFDPAFAAYIAKYIMKKQRGLNCIEDIDTIERCRGDGSRAELVLMSKGRKNGGVGYPAIPAFVEKAYESVRLVANLSGDIRSEMLDKIEKYNLEDRFDYQAEKAWLIDLESRGITRAQIDAMGDVFRLACEWWTFSANGKRTAIRPPKYWRQRFFEASGLGDETRKEIRKTYSTMIEATEARKSDAQRERELDKSIQAAARWKAGSMGANVPQNDNLDS